MSYVQGTKVRLDVTITDNDSGLPADPTTLVCRIQDPTPSTQPDQDLDSGVLRLDLGEYRALMDTSSAPGIWRYEWIVDDLSYAKGQINVRSGIPAPA